MEGILEDLKKKSMEYNAIWNGENQFEVETSHGPRYKVHLGEGTCGCRRWELSGLPCAHVIACINYLGLNVEEYVHQCYKKDTFLISYSHFMGAMEGEDMWPKTKWVPLIPPASQRLPGRPKEYKRKPQGGETSTVQATQASSKRKGKGKDKPVKLTRKGTVITCSYCHHPNHNARACPKKPKAPVAQEESQGGMDIPAADDEGTSRSRKRVSNLFSTSLPIITILI